MRRRCLPSGLRRRSSGRCCATCCRCRSTCRCCRSAPCRCRSCSSQGLLITRTRSKYAELRAEDGAIGRLRGLERRLVVSVRRKRPPHGRGYRLRQKIGTAPSCHSGNCSDLDSIDRVACCSRTKILFDLCSAPEHWRYRRGIFRPLELGPRHCLTESTWPYRVYNAEPTSHRIS